MPVARSKADIICLAVYTLTGGRLNQDRMVSTVAQGLGIPFGRASEIADVADAAGLIEHVHGSVSLRPKGQKRGATLQPPSP